MSKRLRMVCSHCGSTEVTRDAICRWSEEDQQWEVSTLLDNTDCCECGGETRINEEILPDA